MSQFAEPVRTPVPKAPDRHGPAPATATPARCLGAAAQLAAVHRTLAGGLPLKVRATQPTGRPAQSVARPAGQATSRIGVAQGSALPVTRSSPPAISAVIVSPPIPTRSGNPIQMVIDAVMMRDVGEEVYAYSAQTGYSYSFPADHGLVPGTLVQFDVDQDNEPDPATIVVVQAQGGAGMASAASSSASVNVAAATSTTATAASPAIYGLALLQAEIGGTFRPTVGGAQQSSDDFALNDRIKCHISIIVANPADVHVSFYPANDASYQGKILHVHYRWISAERRFGAPSVIRASWKAYSGDYSTMTQAAQSQIDTLQQHLRQRLPS